MLCHYLVQLQTLDNMKEVLIAAKSSFENGECLQDTHQVSTCEVVVVKVTVFLADINDYPTVNEVYSQCKCVILNYH